jgi:hypothetical protein
MITVVFKDRPPEHRVCGPRTAAFHLARAVALQDGALRRPSRRDPRAPGSAGTHVRRVSA